MVVPNFRNEEYPFEPHFFELASKNTSESSKLHYIDEGEGEVLLCVHGNPTWSFFYRNVVKKFSKSHRVIALDNLACGKSSFPQDASYKLEDHIKNLEDFIGSLGVEKVTLLVHDWGGAIGLGWAVKHAARVKGLIILNTAAFLSQDIPKRIAICRLPFIGEWAMRKWNAFALAASVMASKKPLSLEVRNGYLWPYSSYEKRIAIARFVQDIPLEKSHPSYECLASIEENLKKLTCPKLILWGMKDFCFNEKFLNRWMEFYPEAEVKKFHDAGHYILEDKTEESLASIGKFLN